MSSPLISIVIPTYNGENFIREALESCLEQSYSNLEILVVDDGSKDHTPEIVEKYEKKDSRVRLIVHDKNKGVAAARNTGIKASKGTHLQFLDQDDLFFLNKTEIMLKQITPEVDLLYCEVFCWYLMMDAIIPNHYGDLPNRKTALKEMFGKSFGTPLSWMIKKEIVKKIGFFDEELRGSDDWEFLFRVLRLCNYKRCDSYLAFYRIHSTNQTLLTEEQYKNSDKACLKAVLNTPPEELFDEDFASGYEFLADRIQTQYESMNKENWLYLYLPYKTLLEIYQKAYKLSYDNHQKERISEKIKKTQDHK